ncbi:hypothetical protein FACS1894147_01650 [Spirochaetia bacterium]|nr:hypothetical protein FACS1894147_01650 [Spirochaetia bacterium]
MRNFLMVILSVFVVLLSACGKAYPNDTSFIAKIRGGSLEITDYKGNELDIVIPDAINGIPVSSISTHNFINKCNSIIIPESVKAIKGKGSLAAIFVKSKLTRITIGENVTIEKNSAKGGIGRFNEFRVDCDKNDKKAGVYIYESGNIVEKILLGRNWRIE